MDNHGFIANYISDGAKCRADLVAYANLGGGRGALGEQGGIAPCGPTGTQFCLIL
jgi:hypothetical protein